MPNNKFLFKAIANWIPPEQRAEFLHFMEHVKKLPKDDEYLRCIEAMAILTALARQVPAEVAVQLDAIAQTLGEVVAAARQENDRLAQIMKDGADEIVRFHKNRWTTLHAEMVMDNMLLIYESKFNEFLENLPNEGFQVFADKVERASSGLDNVEARTDAIKAKVKTLVPEFEEEIKKAVGLGNQLKNTIAETLRNRLTYEQGRRLWPWMAAGIGACLATAGVSWYAGASLQQLRDKTNVQFVEAARLELEKSNVKVTLIDTGESLVLELPRERIDESNTFFGTSGTRQIYQLAVKK